MKVGFGDVTAAVIAGLNSLGVTVAGKVPAARPARFVTVTRTGGPRRDRLVDDAQITVDSWGTSSADALGLAEKARTAVHELVGRTSAGVFIIGTQEVSGPAYLPDVSGVDRYRQTFVVSTKGTTK